MLMKPKPIGSYWSDDQWKAISEAGGNMLIAAAAGSGKTAVLVERIIRKLMDEERPLDVDRLLVATFTKAAASEMRQRIREALEKELDKDSGNEHLSRQLAMLGRASITTLHSFCMEVIQKHYTLIPLDPGFRIASESETRLLRQEVLEELFEEKYGAEPEDSLFLQLSEWFGGERSDAGFFALVEYLYEFSRSHSWPEDWLHQAASVFEMQSVDELESSVWVQSIIKDVSMSLDGVLGLLRQGHSIAQSPGGPEPYAQTLAEDISYIESVRLAAEHEPWSALYRHFQAVQFGKLKPCKKDQCEPALQDRVKALREEAKKLFGELRSQLFGRTAEDFLGELQRMAPLMRRLASFIIEFTDRYRLAKASKGWLDFSDLEHYCLQILRHPSSTPERSLPSDAALEYRDLYEEVLLDEYQDTNTVQEDIVRLISRESPGNRFMVGDVKQSIYRFRLAEPGLFLEKYKSYGSDFSGTGMRIDLARNFRSRKEVVHAVNMLFRQVMNEGVAEITYDDRAELVYGEGFPVSPEDSDYRPEMMLIDRGGESADPQAGEDEGNGESESGIGTAAEGDVLELETVRLEARAIASRIHSLMGEGGRPPMLVYDKHRKEMRPVAYRDMVILLRSTLSWAPAMIDELRLAGIPATGELSQGYFEASEVETMLSLLQIIDNPLQDIPLAAVLRSPLYNLSEEELANIRLAKSKGNFFEAVMAYLAEDEAEEVGSKDTRPSNQSLKRKLTEFILQLNQWRDAAREGELSHLIWSIYRETGYLDWVAGLRGGDQRQANLRALHDRARQYEMSTSSKGLFRFLRYVTRLRENGGDLGAALGAGAQEDSVQLMTIHKSKGLEFPVVFVAGLSKMFNRQDLNAQFMIHKELGFGPKYIDEDRRVSYPSLPHLAIRRRAQMELLAEEMRVLYVALTRPKDKLILVSAVKDLAKAVDSWSQALAIQEEELPDYLLARGRSYLDWIGPALIRHHSAGELRKFGGLVDPPSAVLMDNPSHWIIAITTTKDPMITGQFLSGVSAEAAAAREWTATESAKLNALLTMKPVPLNEEDLTLKELVDGRLGWAYPYEASTHISAKTSVTELKSTYGSQGEDTDSASDLFSNMAFQQQMESGGKDEIEFTLSMRRPRFMERTSLTPTERGTAYHMLMQHLPFDQEAEEDVVRDTLARLIDRQIMTAEQATVIDISRITGFLRSSVGRLLARADWIKREMPFSYGLSAKEAYPQFAASVNGDLNATHDLFNMAAREALEHETVLIQGVVDCLFSVDGKQYLLDYKSDRVLELRGGVAALAEHYRFQLDLYTRAVSEITGVTIEEKWLYFFDSGETVRL